MPFKDADLSWESQCEKWPLLKGVWEHSEKTESQKESGFQVTQPDHAELIFGPYPRESEHIAALQGGPHHRPDGLVRLVQGSQIVMSL